MKLNFLQYDCKIVVKSEKYRTTLPKDLEKSSSLMNVFNSHACFLQKIVTLLKFLTSFFLLCIMLIVW